MGATTSIAGSLGKYRALLQRNLSKKLVMVVFLAGAFGMFLFRYHLHSFFKTAKSKLVGEENTLQTKCKQLKKRVKQMSVDNPSIKRITT